MNYNMTGNTGVVGGYSESINIPGTIVGTLKDVAATNQYLQNVQRYNNYLISNYGAAQEASDRYMTLKERIPMSIEYYLTPKEKKEVVLYINPNKISINTQKLKAKVVTRGGIYFHHYGDDIWNMTITGETGLSNMKGIEALEEVYHYSGALLKYQGITQQTVHTNNIGNMSQSNSNDNSGLFGGLLGGIGLGGFGESVTKYLNDKVVGTMKDKFGFDNKSLGISLKGGDCFGGNSNNAANNNLIGGITSSMLGTFAQGAISSSFGNLGVDTGKSFKTNMDNTKNALGTLMQGFDKNTIGNLAAEIVLGGLGGGGDPYTQQLGFNLDNAIGAISDLLSGNNSNTPLSNLSTYQRKSTQGNFYVLGHLSASNLNLIVNSVQAVNKNNLIDHQRVASNWSDMEDHYTDLYRPRQIFIYFDDRVFIGHFDSFNWTRQATTKSISYDMKFTVCRQVIVQRNQQGFVYGNSGGGGLFGGGLGGVLTGVGIGLLGGAVGGLFSGSTNTKAGTSWSGGKNIDTLTNGFTGMVNSGTTYSGGANVNLFGNPANSQLNWGRQPYDDPRKKNYLGDISF